MSNLKPASLFLIETGSYLSFVIFLNSVYVVGYLWYQGIYRYTRTYICRSQNRVCWYSLFFSVNVNIRWFTQRMYTMPKISRHCQHTLTFAAFYFTIQCQAIGRYTFRIGTTWHDDDIFFWIQAQFVVKHPVRNSRQIMFNHVANLTFSTCLLGIERLLNRPRTGSYQNKSILRKDTVSKHVERFDWYSAH